MTKHIKNRVMLISGGASGIGASCVALFLKNGYYVYNLDIKNNLQFADSDYYTWINTDVSVEGEIIQALTTLKSDKISINTLIISAGQHLSANIENTSSEDLIRIVNLNILGAFWLIQNTIGLMDEESNVITIGSDQYLIAKPNSAAYGMSKAALAQLTKSIALDYAKYKIRANCIGAGTIDTPLYRAAINNYSQKTGIDINDIEADENAQQPIGRIGSAHEIAELALYLASDAAKFITGAYIPIDGGYTAR